ncbi:hypothetical protein MWH25_06055 [Natroniella acetigena]|uniref:hypothetical protein n=1 Tax=Natroniella acetigena TaxID=52004 RepID=UPI00200B96B1|nr:hypothetical protein [Natroniella acetigena]MCK8827304.1 hypothetical protein [Natroniella acetigena]
MFRKKKSIIFFSLILSSLLLLTGCFSSDSSDSDSSVVWEEYANSENGYGIKYPAEWKEYDLALGDTFQGSDGMRSLGVDVLFSPVDFEDTDYLFYAQVIENKEGIDFDDQDQLEKIREDFLEALSGLTEDLDVNDEGVKEIGGKDGYIFDLSLTILGEDDTMEDGNIKMAITAKNNLVFNLLFMSVEDEYSSNIGIVDEMIDSFEFSN